MKRLIQILCIALSTAILSACVATIPIKAAKVGVKTTKKTVKVTVKTTAKAGGILIPNAKDKDEE